MIVLDIVLKLWIELIKSRNDNAMEKFYCGFKKLIFLVEISKISKILEKLQFHRGMRSCSTRYPSGNQVDGSPLVAIAKLARLGPAKKGTTRPKNDRVDKVLLDEVY